MILVAAARYGPATCACVPYFEWSLSWLLKASADRVRGDAKGWPLCPFCGGRGVDARIPVDEGAMPMVTESVA